VATRSSRITSRTRYSTLHSTPCVVGVGVWVQASLLGSGGLGCRAFGDLDRPRDELRAAKSRGDDGLLHGSLRAVLVVYRAGRCGSRSLAELLPPLGGSRRAP